MSFQTLSASLSLGTAQDYCEGKQIQVSNSEYKSSTCNRFVIVRKAIAHEFLVNQKQLDLQKKETVRNKFSIKKKHRHFSHYWSPSELIVFVSKYSKLVKKKRPHFYSGWLRNKVGAFNSVATVTGACRNALKRWIQNPSDMVRFKSLNKMKSNRVPVMPAEKAGITVQSTPNC